MASNERLSLRQDGLQDAWERLSNYEAEPSSGKCCKGWAACFSYLKALAPVFMAFSLCIASG